MDELTSRERFRCMYAHQEADRIPIIDYPWPSTLARWYHEGMPGYMDYVEYFGLDRWAEFRVDNSPRYPKQILQETGDFLIETTEFGVTLKNWKNASSTPQFIDFTIKDPDSWKKAKELITPSGDRIDWYYLDKHFNRWRQQGAWIEATLWFGFDVTHSWIVGTERTLIALAENPEWLMDMFNHLLETNLALLDQVWDAGFHFDGIVWYDDMGYKDHTFFSLKMYQNYLQPYHQRAIDWAHTKGIKTRLHSCGNIMKFVPTLVGMGLDGLNPLEVKAGMDAFALKKQYGDRLVLHGGVNAVYYDQPEKIQEEIRQKIPILMQNGGYIFSSDHSVPDSVSLNDFQRIVDLAKQLGTYS